MQIPSNNSAAIPAAPRVQFCLQQIGKTNQYRLLKSIPPQKNVPAEYSEEVGCGTIEEMVELKRKVLGGWAV